MAPITIAVDAMGGDHGLAVTLPAVAQFIKQNQRAKILLVGQEQAIRSQLATFRLDNEARVSIIHASEVEAMDDQHSVALMEKRDSSMRIAAQLLKQQKTQAMFSSGNTGALLAVSRLVLRTRPGIDWSVIC